MTNDRDEEIRFLLLQAERAGISIEDLLAARDGGGGCPTLRAFREKALDAINNPNTHGTYRTYIDYLIDGDPREVCTCACRPCTRRDHCGSGQCANRFDGLADVPLRRITAHDIRHAGQIRAALAVSDAVARAERQEQKRPGSSKPVTTTGIGAHRHVYGAARHVMRVALDHQILITDPLSGLKNPAAPPVRPARSYELDVFDAIVEEICLGGDDPELDALLVAFRLETGARSGGERNLRKSGLLPHTCQVVFEEKRDRIFDKPISPGLMQALQRHVAERGDPDAGPDGPVFHYRPDKPYRAPNPATGCWETRVGYHPVGKSRTETIIRRIKKAVPEADEQGFRLHDLRHHVGSILERVFGPASAAAYLGHVPDDPTAGYTQARQSEISAHHRWLTGADSNGDPDPDGDEGDL